MINIFFEGDIDMKITEIVTTIICNTLMDPTVLDRSRRRKGAFSRNCGKLPFWTVIKLLLSNIKRTVNSMLDEFFTSLARLSGSSVVTTCSQQAFSKARAGIDHTIFKECFEKMLDFLCTKESHEFHHRLGGLWGLQIISIDGSKISLPNRKILLGKYGGMGGGASSPTALASIAFDVLNERVLDAQFEPLATGERNLAMRHIGTIKAKDLTDLLYTMFVFDRGYASKDLILYIQNTIQSRYLFRVRDKFNLTIDSLPRPDGSGMIDQTLELYEGVRVRVLRFNLPSGILETLITNDFERNAEMFRQLYFLRWPVEEEYLLIKEKIGLTCFRGYSENSILQEFWISMLLTNLANVIKQETDGIIKHEHSTKPWLKHEYKTNMNELAGGLSRHLPDLLDADTPYEKHCIIKNIFNFMIHHPVIDKKGTGESNPRKLARNVDWHYNVKLTH